MPAKSEAQRRFFALLVALKRGKANPQRVSAHAREAAKRVSLQDALDFARKRRRP
jgi:hypothetical protein